MYNNDLTEQYATFFVYGFPFEVKGYLVTWAWYGAVCVMASGVRSSCEALTDDPTAPKCSATLPRWR